MLLKGLALEDVSRLLGHSSVQVTEKYYAKWTLGRKRRLEKIVGDVMTPQKSGGTGLNSNNQGGGDSSLAGGDQQGSDSL